MKQNVRNAKVITVKEDVRKKVVLSVLMIHFGINGAIKSAHYIVKIKNVRKILEIVNVKSISEENSVTNAFSIIQEQTVRIFVIGDAISQKNLILIVI